MYNYCTLFNSNYLTRGLAMYESLRTHSGEFHLYVFAFDDKSYDLLEGIGLDDMTVISLVTFEDEVLLKVKGDRSAREYCWTCTPSTIKYCIEKYGLDSCTYLDADLYFFANPAVLIEEMGDKSVLITEHRYNPEYDQSADSGIYCVQFMTFKNDANGMKILNWWRDACNEWCYARFEEGKFGDQKYLDDWTTRFKGVHVLENLGGGVAPWNVQQYGLDDGAFELIFYHFHNYKFLENNTVECGDYKLNENAIDVLYKPYTIHLERVTQQLKNIDQKSDYNGIVKVKLFHWRYLLRILKRKFKGNYNVFNKRELLAK